MKLWTRADEWTGYAPCGGDPAFTTDEERLEPADIDRVENTCAGCPVRPECIRDALRDNSNAVWVAGQYIPDNYTRESRAEGKLVRLNLFQSIPSELSWRPDAIL